MDLDKIKGEEDRKLSRKIKLNELVEKENSLYYKLLDLYTTYNESKVILHNKQVKTDQIRNDFKEIFESKGFTIHKIDFSLEAEYRDFKVRLEPIGDYNYLLKFPNGNYFDIIVEEAKDYQYSQKYHGYIDKATCKKTYLGTHTEKELNESSFIEKEISLLEEDIREMKKILENVDKIEFKYKFGDGCGIDGEFSKLEEMINRIPD